jgi:DNA polymerase
VDFETFKYDWLCVLINPIKKTETVIVNDPDKLKKFYEENKNTIYCGYNIRGYDQWIYKAILAGFNPYDMNEHIITKNKKGHEFSNVLRNFPLVFYDVAQFGASLKQLEAMQGHSIYESEVDFRLNRKLTQAEIDETIRYCRNDVEETMSIFLKKKADFDVQMELIHEFKLPLNSISKTQTQLTAEILGAKRRECTDEFNLNFPDYLNKIKKYKNIVNWFKQFKTDKNFTDEQKKEIYKNKLECFVAGAPHVFGWGGLHGAKPKYYGTGYYLHIDVSQYYPSLTVTHNYFSRATTEEGKRRYDMMRRESIRLKAFPELANKRAGYKLCNNKAYGAMKDIYNALYDPLMANNICVTGQLALLLLIEMLEPHCELIQSNTDGLIVRIDTLDKYEVIDDICYEWECMTGVSLAFDPIITKIYQKDVNNYVFINEDDEVECKGAYVKKLNPLDYDLPIVNKALKEYMIHGTPVESTVNKCDDLIEYQKIVKLSSKYNSVMHNMNKYTHKCYRVFASTDNTDGMIYKCRDGKSDKFANTPEKCFLENGDIRGAKVPAKLDKQYYINLAYDRLEQYGIGG